MTDENRTERIRALVAGLSADDEERDRLKDRADEALSRLHEAADEFAAGARRGTAGGAHPCARTAAS
jgi:hypothetical protein